MVLNRFPLPVIGLAVAALGLAACTAETPVATPSSGTVSATTASQTTPATPTVTPTPSPTLDADQAAALEVASRYSAALAKIRSTPIYSEQEMIRLLKPLAYDDMIQANLNFMATWRARGWRDSGTIATLSEDASQVSTLASGDTRVTVTFCRDQSKAEVVDARGKRVTAKAAQFPDFIRSTYDLRRLDGAKAFKVYEIGGEEVDGCV
ncbi:hypothetical protein PROP_02960 [Propionicimonas sp. T2.31MG-18]|uniref:hypothetical protein n=1 Tax=Propionicimonas sp. T2.31MG-18 TaxID=3157620 RepID=UPI0035E5A08A